MLCLAAGGGAYQTRMKRLAAPGYPSRPDIAVHVVTIQVPLEGTLQTGGIAFVLKTGQQQWLACRAEGVLRSDFFISTHQVMLCPLWSALWRNACSQGLPSIPNMVPDMPEQPCHQRGGTHIR